MSCLCRGLVSCLLVGLLSGWSGVGLQAQETSGAETVAQEKTAQEKKAEEKKAEDAKAEEVKSEGSAEPTLRLPFKEAETQSGEIVTLKLHVFRPEGWKAGDKRTGMVLFFGGGWVGGSPSQFYPHAKHYSDAGAVVFCAEYRVRNAHGTSPYESVADGRDAVAYVRERATELGVDPERLVIGGGSAGGHVALSSVLIPATGSEQPAEEAWNPAAMLLFNPVTDTSREGYGYDRFKERYKELSPREFLRGGLAPTIMFFGTDDAIGNTAREFCLESQALGNRCDLWLYEGEKHGFFNYRNRAAYQSTVDLADRFLSELGLIELELSASASGAGLSPELFGVDEGDDVGSESDQD